MRLVGRLNNVEKILTGYKSKIKQPEFHEKLLQKIKYIAHEIDRGTHISIREEGYIHAQARG